MIHATKNETATTGENVCFNHFISCEILKTKQNKNKKKREKRKKERKKEKERKARTETKFTELLGENYSRPGSYGPSISFMVNANTLEIVCTMF